MVPLMVATIIRYTHTMKITIYTDGSSRGNPGPGGWGTILLTDKHEASDENEVIELGGREDLTTNNRMELMATIEGLRHVAGTWLNLTSGEGEAVREELQSTPHTLQAVEINTDSEYVKKGMTEWIEGWIKKGWKTSTKKDVLNRDLWERLHHEVTRVQRSGVVITWKYVRGHTGVPGNERADTIATACADNASHLQLYRGERSAYPFF